MAYLDEVCIDTSQDFPAGYPFEIPVIESFDSVKLDSGVTFFVGENGCGKSSLLEAIAVGMKCPTVGAADAWSDPMLADARRLAKTMTFRRSVNAKRKMFFRAEDAIGFTNRVQSDVEDLDEMREGYEKSLKGYARQMAMGVVNGQKAAYTSRYGDNPDAKSHGEWFLDLLKGRLNPNGLYLLDEPETPLSPIHQLTLLSLIMEMLKSNCQFIIATHSPILMALPGALILQFDQTIQSVAWDDVEHVEITRSFLNNPQSYLRHL
jgi:predicted ATPase